MWYWRERKPDWVNWAFGIGLLVGIILVLVLSAFQIKDGQFPYALVTLIGVAALAAILIRLESR